MLFKLGMIVHTSGFQEAAGDELLEVMSGLVNRHRSGDWGDLCDEDKEMNNHAVIPGNDQRVLSRYEVNGEPVYVITEWDRSVTTLLLRSEY